MNAERHPAPADDAVAEELVAYLDGELEPEAQHRVEERLARDEEYRQRLRQLQRSWDLLDRLPKAEVDPSFTESTVAMVAVTARDAVEDQQRKAARRQWALWGFGGLAAAAALIVGYGLVRSITAGQDRRLLSDLPVIEQLDAYRYADSIEFLRMLDAEGLFVEEDVERTASSYGSRK